MPLLADSRSVCDVREPLGDNADADGRVSEEVPMCRRFLLLLTVIALTGCNRYSGPLETRQMGRADPMEIDQNGEKRPIYSIDDQKLRGRERYAITEDDFRIGPNGYISRPSPIGR